MKPTRRILFALAALAVLGGSALAAAPAPAPASAAPVPLAAGMPQTADLGGGGGDGGRHNRLFLRFHNTLRCHSRVRVSFSDRTDLTWEVPPQEEREFTVDGWRDESAVTGVSAETFGCTGSVQSGTTCSRWFGRWTSRFHRHIRFEIFGTNGGHGCGLTFDKEY